MTVRHVDEYTYDDPDDGWFGQAADMELETTEPETTEPDTDSWYVPAADPNSAEYEPDVAPDPVRESASAPEFEYVPTRRHGFVAAPRPGSFESRVANSGAWDFKASPSPRPWYRSKYGVIAALVVTAAAVLGVVLLLRSPGPAADDSTTVAPSRSTEPAPASQAPTLSPQAPVPAPPPGPPLPPPPASADEISPPAVNRQYYPRYQTPDAPKKPQLDVTRAPMSATPPPPPKPDRNSSTPGDAPRRHGFF